MLQKAVEPTYSSFLLCCTAVASPVSCHISDRQTWDRRFIVSLLYLVSVLNAFCRKWLSSVHFVLHWSFILSCSSVLQADLDSRLASPRPRPRLWGSKTKTKTLMSKTKTETQDLQDQYWKFMTGMDCDKQKDWKVMASRKSSILVVAHSKQQDITPCLTTVLFRQLPLIIAVYQTFANTRNISKVWCLINN